MICPFHFFSIDEYHAKKTIKENKARRDNTATIVGSVIVMWTDITHRAAMTTIQLNKQMLAKMDPDQTAMHYILDHLGPVVSFLWVLSATKNDR